MDDESRIVLVDSMPEKIKYMIMKEAAKLQTQVSEEMDESDEVQIEKTGKFVGLAVPNIR